MLPSISLDDERFEEIVEKARKMIPNLYPEWTDYNDHDPGITMLELFAWLKEIQQFHMDQIGPLHLSRYLKLLGEQPGAITPAMTRIWVTPETESVLLRGSRFYARDIPFETEHTRFLTASRIQTLVMAGAKESLETGMEIPVTGTSLELPVFEKEMGRGACLYMGLKKPLEPGEEHWLYLSFSDPYPVKRNPIAGASSFVPLVKLVPEYETDRGFISVEAWEDGTHGLLENGCVKLLLEQSQKQGFQGLYWLRLRLEEGAYDVPPVLSLLTFHGLEARQQKTLSEVYETSLEGKEQAVVLADSYLAKTGAYECFLETGEGLHRYEGKVIRKEEEKGVSFFLPDYQSGTAQGITIVCYEEDISHKRLLGVGTGFPNQEFDGEIEGLCKEGLRLMVETYEGSGVFRMWQQTEDFTGSSFTDLHYCYDERTGVFSFGDCDRGCVPEGRILLVSGRISLGQGGNVKADAVSRYEKDAAVMEIRNPEAAGSGRDPETIIECSARLQRRLKQTQRAVTYEDYEALVLQTPGLRIEGVKVIPVTERRKQGKTAEEKKVAVVVKPYSLEPMPPLPKAYAEGILHMLEPRRLIGTRVTVLPPEYIGISIFAEIETDSYYQQTREAVKLALEGYFTAAANCFGQPVLYGTIYGIIDVLEHVTHVKSISLDAQGRGVKRTMNQDVLLPANGLAYLKEWDCMISSAR